MTLRTSFEEGTLLPALKWHCEPARWSVRADDRCLRIEPDAGTDFWRTTHYGFDADNGAFLFGDVAEDFVRAGDGDGAWRVQYTPDAGYVGEDAFSYEARSADATGRSIVLKVHLKVTVRPGS